MKPAVVVITGPTGSGKSNLAIDVAQALQRNHSVSTELINADSIQVYKGFDIGSGKPTQAELKTVPHHLVSTVEPTDPFDAGQFVDSGRVLIDEILKRKCIPIIVGGTGLYVRSLLCGLVEGTEPSAVAREKLEALEADLIANGLSGEALNRTLHEKLAELDPYTAAAIRTSDTQRIRRALVVFFSTGESLLRMQELHEHSARNYRALVIALMPEREMLYERINQRVDQMFAEGFVEEVRSLREKYGSRIKPMLSLGYRHVVEYLDGKIDEGEARERMKQQTRQYAKRQLTWWRHQPERLGWTHAETAVNSELSRSEGDNIKGLTVILKRFILAEKPFHEEGIAFLALGNLNSAPKKNGPDFCHPHN